MSCFKKGVVVLFGFSAFGQSNLQEHEIHSYVQAQTEEIFDSLVAIRRDFHVYPEVSEQEKRTSEKITEYLTALGLEVKTGIGGYGVVGILKGERPGKSIAWRADIDAMPSNIPDVVAFESKNEGVRHICGHDVHTAIGLGIANVLSGQKDSLKGNVYFVFQPSEENYKGAKAMIDDGLFQKISADEIYGLHISPFPVGSIATKAGNIYAHTNRVEVVYQKSGNEDSLINYTKKLISGLQNVPADSEFWNPANLGDPEIGIENPNTVFKDFLAVKENFEIDQTNDQLVIKAYLHSDDKKPLDTFLTVLRKTLTDSEYSENLISADYSYEKAVVVNDKDLTEKTVNSIKEIYGEKSVIPLYGVVTADRGDDFAYFQKEIPGVYFFLGGANYETGMIPMPHSPDFAVDEESIKVGVNYFSSMIIERLKAE
ncbi:amidohydrolase [Salinimicrobium marinum]|uniref:Amidohydrolase n=2 Tax=Salinimicrobium marinum TaxID=680283 RepID=A0A918S6E0_9FLAO|nr:amidohydrolase [Salinimicrobium marinum]